MDNFKWTDELVKPKRIINKVKECIGNRYGILTALEIAGNKNNRTYIHCKCDCGGERIVSFNKLNKTKSCGCKRIQHGDSKSRLYVVYMGVKNRCNLKRKHYGADGISMCDEWSNDYRVFKKWALDNGWQHGLEIDRFPDQKGNYEPTNCRIVTKIENLYNRSVTLHVNYKGELKTVGDLVKISGLPRKVVYSRIFVHKMEIEKALTNPYKKGYEKYNN